ncbi:MAG TPA: glucosaminidase domain-containing protein [Chitinophagaceae bacterium]|nr:glucosaminidase domain-containing protein [Chitinophagaceae bacterium]
MKSLGKFLLPVILLSSSHLLSAQSEYVQKYSDLADSLSEVYGIPAAVILGIAIIESSSGTSRNCRLLNNHFGIVGRNDLLKTKKIKTRYKQYPNDTSSYVDFCRLMTRKRFYYRLKGNKDYKLWIDAISKAKYSEVPVVWRQRILDAIRKNKLSVPHKTD